MACATYCSTPIGVAVATLTLCPSGVITSQYCCNGFRYSKVLSQKVTCTLPSSYAVNVPQSATSCCSCMQLARCRADASSSLQLSASCRGSVTSAHLPPFADVFAPNCLHRHQWINQRKLNHCPQTPCRHCLNDMCG